MVPLTDPAIRGQESLSPSSAPPPRSRPEPNRARSESRVPSWVVDPAERVLRRGFLKALAQKWMGLLGGVTNQAGSWKEQAKEGRSGQQQSLAEYSAQARRIVESTRSQQSQIVARKSVERRSCHEHIRLSRQDARMGGPTRDLEPLQAAIGNHQQRNVDLHRLDSFQREEVNYRRTQAERMRDNYLSINRAVAAAMSKTLGEMMLLNSNLGVNSQILQEMGGEVASQAAEQREQISASFRELGDSLGRTEWDVEADRLSHEQLSLGEAEVAQARAVCSERKTWLQEELKANPDSRQLWSSLVQSSTREN